MTTQPSKREQVEPLLEALEYIAKMVKQRGAFNRNDIPMLLSASGVDPEWGEEQLKRWAKILKAVHEDSSKLQLGQDALMKFGIPEAHAMLAVSMVSTGASKPGPLSASKSRLDFGTLSSGEPVKAEFEVQGGPGEIVVESDRVRVDPRQFSGGNTKVRLEISPLKSGLLWSSIKLVAANETLELPVMAQWSDVPRTYSQQTLVVDANGGGDCKTIEEAVQKAQAGATIEVKAGVYHLSLPLQIDKPLVLVGEGMDVTKIVCEAEGYVVKYTGDGLFLAHDLTFDHQGFQWANVVEVVTGEIDFRRCRFTGGFFDAGGNRGGTGLYLLGDVRGSVAECEATNNGLHGICVANQAQPTLEANTCQGNKYAGIVYFGNATGTARQNTCTGNELHGIAVQEQAQPTLEANTCQGNKYGGIVYFGNATGTARQNTCTGNEMNGIGVQEQAQPTLEANTCQGNKCGGIVYFGNATGTARQNTCTGNETNGISVQGEAQPVLEANTCQGNKYRGIAYSGNAAGTARQNTCIGNEIDGISVQEQAQPTLEANTCHGNKQDGIYYSGNATGTARQNTCTGNEIDGISVQEQAQPTLEANTCHGNKYRGILYSGNATGTARQNTCTSNETNGIAVQEQAQPTLEANTCQGNKQIGIAYFGNATGTARQNTCTDNEMYGIYVVSTADPILENNYCDENQQKNLEDQR
ncbi:right-handed parallel beta-helix repeat-containing protein [Microcoleus sp. LEGE 07076]|uniref:right-handed parallel beta-helix repeat-containing protein n=1 Tax=Microcoleus sp. LEGE 07076 TaxID=915322 RepID=UPI0018820445|nr:right-handed parallel beta-helix repeat-containing protein [Microcoleus sp. LEGE 07076]MBE9183283.1 right-handed parallel beta-helix repeat-containing protein [Microcoleus sp. LEGE 07076]